MSPMHAASAYPQVNAELARVRTWHVIKRWRKRTGARSARDLGGCLRMSLHVQE